MLANFHLSHFETAQFNRTYVSVGGSGFCFAISLGRLTVHSLREYSGYNQSSNSGSNPKNDCGGGVFIVGNPKVRNDMFDPK